MSRLSTPGNEKESNPDTVAPQRIDGPHQKSPTDSHGKPRLPIRRGYGNHRSCRSPRRHPAGTTLSQNLISLSFTDEQRDALSNAMLQLEAVLTDLVSLDADQRRQLLKMGDKSEAFCRQTLSVLDQNRQVVPPSLGLDDALADLAALDVLRPLMQRLSKLLERIQDTDTALGSDIMSTSVEGYGLLKVVGRNQGLDGLRKELGVRFARSGRTAAPAPAPATEGTGT